MLLERVEPLPGAEDAEPVAAGKSIASKTFGFPIPVAPAMHVNAPNRRSKFTRFLNPSTCSRTDMLANLAKYDNVS
jgi:hypothetical protein